MEITAATVTELITELNGREEFDGAVVVATLGVAPAPDTAYVYFADSLAAFPTWRKFEFLTRAKEHGEHLDTSPSL